MWFTRFCWSRIEARDAGTQMGAAFFDILFSQMVDWKSKTSNPSPRGTLRSAAWAIASWTLMTSPTCIPIVLNMKFSKNSTQVVVFMHRVTFQFWSWNGKSPYLCCRSNQSPRHRLLGVISPCLCRPKLARKEQVNFVLCCTCKTWKICLLCPQGSCFNFTPISQLALPISLYGRSLSVSQHDSCQWKLIQRSWIPPVSVISACSSTLLMSLFVSSFTVHKTSTVYH